MAKKKATSKKTQTKIMYVLDNGAEYEVLSENGKYYICEGTQFRKASAQGKLVKVEVPVVEETQAKEGD